jgi:hypothetical protein
MKAPEDIELPPSPPLHPVMEIGRDPHSPSLPHPIITSFDSRPQTPPRVAFSAPSPVLAPSPIFSSPGLGPSSKAQLKTRNQSPASRGHLRCHTSTGTMTLPPMQRAHSSPGVDSTGRVVQPPFSGLQRPASPLGHSSRRRSPLRSAMEEVYPPGPTWGGLFIEPNIPEHAELDISSTSLLPHNSIPDVPLHYSAYNTVPRSRRGPSSPLYLSSPTPSLSKATNSPLSGADSPVLNAQRYSNEPYPLQPALSFGSGSSISSTPTSLRSRSPSISSLETIPDTPDAEEIARLEEADDLQRRRGDYDEADGRVVRRKTSLEMRLGGKEKRKRWSVCGAERRGDFSLEVIEE